MRLLLDTHLLLWALAEPARLGPELRTLVEDPAQEVFFSAASIWEVAIKASLGRADFAVQPGEILGAATATGFVELLVRAEVAARVADLPLHHRDPFDRLLVAQAMAEPMRFYTVLSALAPRVLQVAGDTRLGHAACMMRSAIRAPLAKRERRSGAGTIWLDHLRPPWREC